MIISTFLLTLLVFVIFSYSFVDVNLSYLNDLYTGLYLNNRVLLSVIYLILIAILFGCFYLFVKGADQFKKKIGRLITLVVFISIFAYPGILSFDVFNYVTTAKVTFFYQENPYIIYPIEFLNDPYLAFTRAANKTALYGPLWILLSGIPYFLGVGSFLLTLLSFKALVAFFYLGVVYLLSKLEKSAVLFFALNPLVIIETLVGGHNDVVMMFFALLSILLLKKNKLGLAIVSLLLSVLIKYASIFLVPIFIYYFYQKMKRKEINWDKMYVFSFLSMLVIFLLSPLREELYPWYFIWPLTFLALVWEKRKVLGWFCIFLSAGLMLRYLPFMLTGTYFGSTPIIRETLTLIPVAAFCFYLIVTKKLKLLFK